MPITPFARHTVQAQRSIVAFNQIILLTHLGSPGRLRSRRDREARSPNGWGRHRRQEGYEVAAG